MTQVHPRVTEALAQFASQVSSNEIPRQARDYAIASVTDGIGVLIAGARDQAGQAIREYVTQNGGRPEASLIPGDDKVPAESAALVNGTALHALEFDDISHPAHAHPTCVLLPATVAAAELSGRTGRDVITAYLIGFEIAAALGRAMNISHYRAGWHATSTLGTVGAAAAAAWLLGNDAHGIEMAMGIGASSACGVRGNFGSMTKPLHAGLAAAGAIRAGILATRGWTSAAGSIEIENGFGAAFGGTESPLYEQAIEGLGQRWTILEPHGLAIKAHPSCGGTHPAIDAALLIHTEIGNREISSVHVGRPRLALEVSNHPDPHTREEACFSLEYTVAAALVRGELRLQDLEGSALSDHAVRKVMATITQSIDPQIEDSREYAAIITVGFTDGTQLVRRVDVARGKNANPLTSHERKVKFKDCVGPGGPELWAAATNIEEGGGLERLLEALHTLPLTQQP